MTQEEQENVCTNCKEYIPPNKLASHTIQCYRNSTKCKICDEVVSRNQKTEHLTKWRSFEKMKDAVKRDDDRMYRLIIEHGGKVNKVIDKNTKESSLHMIARCGASKCLFVLLGNDFGSLDKANKS